MNSTANGTGHAAEEDSSRSAAVGKVPTPPKFSSKEQERAFLKFRLA